MKALACVGMGKSESAIIDGFRVAGLEMDEIIAEELTEKKIKETECLFVFSENFSPAVSAVCQKALMPYLSYVTELPVKELYDKTLKNPCNFIFCFDAAMCVELERRIPGRCFHLPLGAAEQDCLEQEAVEGAEVAFVGSLCRNNEAYDHMEGLSDYARGYMESLVKTQARIYGCDLLKVAVNKEIFKELKRHLPAELLSGVEVGQEQNAVVGTVLFNKVTELERTSLLKAVSEQFETHLYTSEEAVGLSAVHVHGEPETAAERCSVYRNSRINLCFTHRSAVSGIPQQVYEIMACGGFVLMNFQQEISENFIIGEHLDIFTSESEMLEKIAYYLEHEEERARIAAAGRQAVREYHSYLSRAVAMFNTVFSEEEK